MAERTAVVGLSDLSHNCCGALLSEPPRHPATDILKRLSGLPLRAPSAPLMHRWVCLWATFTLSDYVSRPTLYTACRPSHSPFSGEVADYPASGTFRLTWL